MNNVDESIFSTSGCLACTKAKKNKRNIGQFGCNKARKTDLLNDNFCCLIAFAPFKYVLYIYVYIYMLVFKKQEGGTHRSRSTAAQVIPVSLPSSRWRKRREKAFLSPSGWTLSSMLPSKRVSCEEHMVHPTRRQRKKVKKQKHFYLPAVFFWFLYLSSVSLSSFAVFLFILFFGYVISLEYV